MHRYYFPIIRTIQFWNICRTNRASIHFVFWHVYRNYFYSKSWSFISQSPPRYMSHRVSTLGARRKCTTSTSKWRVRRFQSRRQSDTATTTEVTWLLACWDLNVWHAPKMCSYTLLMMLYICSIWQVPKIFEVRKRIVIVFLFDFQYFTMWFDSTLQNLKMHKGSKIFK